MYAEARDRILQRKPSFHKPIKGKLPITMQNPFLKYSIFIAIMAALFVYIRRFFFKLDEAAKDKHYDLFIFLALSLPFVVPALIFREWAVLFLAPQFAFFYMLIHRATIPSHCGRCAKKFHILFNRGLLRCPHCKERVMLKTPKFLRR